MRRYEQRRVRNRSTYWVYHEVRARYFDIRAGAQLSHFDRAEICKYSRPSSSTSVRQYVSFSLQSHATVHVL